MFKAILSLLAMLASPFILIGLGIKTAFFRIKRLSERSTLDWWIVLMAGIITVCTLFSGIALVFLRYFH